MATNAQFIQFGPFFQGGLLLTDAKLYHYEAGTTTLKNVWVDRAKMTTAAQPLLSDSNGLFTCYADGVYKFVLKTAAEATISTWDNWSVAEGETIGEGTPLSSASTIILGNDGNFFHVTGSTTITALSGTLTGVTLAFDGTLTLTHSSNLVLGDGTNVTVNAGDVLTFINDGSGVWREISRNFLYDLPFLMKSITGFTYANAAGDVTNDIDIASGEAVDSTGVYKISTAALTKQLDAAWAVGNNAGGLDTGSIGNSDYYIWTIARSDTGVTDYLFSLSSTAPTMPTNYDRKRLIGWFKRVGGTIVAFTTYESEGGALELLWSVPTLDVNLANTLTTSRRTDAVKVPLNFSVTAHLNIVTADGAGRTCWFYCPDQTDAAPSATVAPLCNNSVQVAGTTDVGQYRIRTSATGTIAARSDLATVDLYAVSTMGFHWARRN